MGADRDLVGIARVPSVRAGADRRALGAGRSPTSWPANASWWSARATWATTSRAGCGRSTPNPPRRAFAPRRCARRRADLPSLLPTVDIVVLVVPLTEQTRGLVDAQFLAAMADNALLVNASRGPVVVTDALLAELRSGRLRAALDVTDPEPPPPDHRSGRAEPAAHPARRRRRARFPAARLSASCASRSCATRRRAAGQRRDVDGY